MKRNVVKRLGDYRVTYYYHNFIEYDEHDEKYIQPTCVIELQMHVYGFFHYRWVTVKAWHVAKDNLEKIDRIKRQAVEGMLMLSH